MVLRTRSYEKRQVPHYSKEDYSSLTALYLNSKWFCLTLVELTINISESFWHRYICCHCPVSKRNHSVSVHGQRETLTVYRAKVSLPNRAGLLSCTIKQKMPKNSIKRVSIRKQTISSWALKSYLQRKTLSRDGLLDIWKGLFTLGDMLLEKAKDANLVSSFWQKSQNSIFWDSDNLRLLEVRFKLAFQLVDKALLYVSMTWGAANSLWIISTETELMSSAQIVEPISFLLVCFVVLVKNDLWKPENVCRVPAPGIWTKSEECS